ncbi:MAG: glycosyl hydrolase family 28-related protein [Armatimonadota bacterium]|nr:glycosyl hydrolase family 28-related protein [Armatimonadota bacterium]
MRIAVTLALFAAFLGTAAIAASDTDGRVNVRDFGAKGDNVTDDTAAIQAAFDANKGGEVVFPPGAYRIRDTIKINGGVIAGIGAASIYQENPQKDTFYSDYAWNMTIRGLQFNNGVGQLNLGNSNVDTGLVIIEKCNFYDSTGPAIRMRKRSNSTHLTVKDCRFVFCDQVLVTHTDSSSFRDSWITTAWSKNKAVIENRGGQMICDAIVGVPLVTGADQRWIDNYGLLVCKGFRFGGEFGGFTPVVNWVKFQKSLGGASVVLEHCWVSALGNNKRRCAVYCEEVPNTLVIRDCELAGVAPVMVSPKIDLKTYFNHARPGMLHFNVSGNAGEFAGKLPVAMLDAAKNRDATPEPIVGQLSPAAVKTALARAVAEVKRMKKTPQQPAEYQGHKQKTDPKDFVDLGPDKFKWDPTDYMDGESVRNSEYVAVAPAGDDVVLLRRASGKWPHVLIRNVTLDLDKTPFLSWKLKDSGVPSGYAVKVMDNQTGRLAMLHEQNWPPFDTYQAFDLRKSFDLKGGKRTFTIKFYALAVDYSTAPPIKEARAGEYMMVDFIRSEAL